MSAPWIDTKKESLIRSASLGLTIGGAYALNRLVVPSPTPVMSAIAQSFNYSLQLADYMNRAGHAPAITDVSLTGLAPAAITVTGGIATTLAMIYTLGPLLRLSGYGDARLGTYADAKRQALAGKRGPLLGKIEGQKLRPKKPRHVLVAAPTRGGKTRGIIMPTLLTHPGSIIAVSSKTELADVTRRYRATLGPVYEIAWTDPHTKNAWSYASLNVLSTDPVELERHAAQVAAQFLPEVGGEAEYFQSNGRRLCSVMHHWQFLEAQRTGVEFHPADMVFKLMVFLPEEQTDTSEVKAAKKAKKAKAPKAGEIAKKVQMFADKEEEPDAWRSEMSEKAPQHSEGSTSSEEDDDADPFGDLLIEMAAHASAHGWPRRIVANLAYFAKMHFKARDQHLTTMITAMDMITYEAVRAATSRCDFKWSELREKPCTVYLQFPTSDKAAFGSLTALFFNSLIAWGLDHPPEPGQQEILIAADEFRSLPKIPNLPDLMTAGAGLGLTIMIVIQEFASLRKTYGEEGQAEIETQCSHWVVMAQSSNDTCDKISKKIGQKTRAKRTTSGGMFKALASSTLTEAAEGVPLVRPEEIQNIPFGSHFLITNGHTQQPLLCKSTFWDQDPVCRKRGDMPVEFQ